MEKVTFGNTGLEVTRLGFGAAPIGYLQTEVEQVERILQHLFDDGVNLIDTAASYLGSEELIGQAIAGRRDELVLVSKCGTEVAGLEAAAWSAKLIEQSVDQSLRRLKTDRLDVMLLHSCDQSVLERGEALGALVKAREAGKIRFAGYSGDNEAAVYAAGLEDVAVMEMSINITDQANIDAVLPICRERGVGVLAKRPIANAAWKDLSEQPGIYSSYAQTYTQRLTAMDLTPHALGFQGHADVEWPEVALRFTLSQPGVHTAIVGTTSQTNARANLAAVAKGPLPDDVVLKIREAFRAAEAAEGQPWAAQT